MADQRPGRVLFARIGWMTFYEGKVPGDSELVGGGAYNESGTGSEVLNFAPHQGRLYGFVQGIKSFPLTLKRIDPHSGDAASVNSTLVIFVAKRPDDGGQVIVGWYRNATVNQEAASDPRPGFRKKRAFNVVAKRREAVLLPTNERWQLVPSGAAAFGQSNVCYSYDSEFHRKKALWIRHAVDYVLGYTGANLVLDRSIETQNQGAEKAEATDAAGQGQGFASTPAQRRAIEEHAMARAFAHFRKRFSKVENVSKQKGVLDLRCGSAGETSIHVEVKGTTTAGDAVILTRREVERARSSPSALYVLHSIKLEGEKASGGTARVIDEWAIRRGSLTPLAFIYKLP